jgi:hypothetical protein
VDSTSIFSLVNFPCLFLLVEVYDPLMLKHFNLQIVDLATLTGACIIALGNEIGGMFSPSDELAEELSAASKRAGEKLWRMPMEEGYWDMMKSNIADMVNTGGRPGGSITAALFLKQVKIHCNFPCIFLLLCCLVSF